MSTFFSKTLFLKEWAYAKWLVMLVTLEFAALCIISFSNYTSDIKSVSGYFRKVTGYPSWQLTFQNHLGNNSGMLLVIITLIILPILIIGSDRQHDRYEILTVMPFKRKQIIFTKWLTSITVIFASQLVMVILTIFMFQINKNVVSKYNNISSLLQWFLIFFLISIIISTFVMIIQCLCGSSVSGVILGITSVIFIPITLESVQSIHYALYGNSLSIIIFYVERFFGQNIIFLPYNISFIDEFQIRYGLVGLILTVLIEIIILLILLIAFFKKNRLEKSGDLIISKSVEYVFRVCIVVSIMLIFAPFGISEGGAHGVVLIRMIANIAISGVLAYFILDKVIRRINK